MFDPERPTLAALMQDSLTAGSDHNSLKRRPSTGKLSPPKYLSIGAQSKRVINFLGLLAVAGLVLGHQVACADEAGVSVWLPGTFGSFAAVPVQPGFQWSTNYYHATATSTSRTEFEEGGRVVTGLKPSPNLIQLSPSYTFETPVLGAQLGVAVTAVPAFVSNSVTATLTGPRGNVARQSGWEDNDNQDENPGVAAHA